MHTQQAWFRVGSRSSTGRDWLSAAAFILALLIKRKHFNLTYSMWSVFQWRTLTTIKQGSIVLKFHFYDNFNSEIHAHSLANFYCQYADRHMNLKFMLGVGEREPAIRQFVIVKNKLMSVFNASVLLLIMNFVITLSKLWWRNSWSITGQTHKKLTSIC